MPFGADTSAYIGRATWLVSDKVAIYGDVGFSDDDDADDTPILVGGGIRALAYNGNQLRVTVFGAGHYVLPFDITQEDFDPSLGRVEFQGEVDYFELTGGALISGNVKMDPTTTFVPYGGLAISILRGQEDIEVNYPDVGMTADASADIEEDEVLQLILGGSLLFNERWSIRAEGRLIGDSSVSAGVGVSF